MKNKKYIPVAALLLAGATLSNAAVYIDFSAVKTTTADNIYTATLWGRPGMTPPTITAGSDSISTNTANKGVFTDGNGTEVTIKIAKLLSTPNVELTQINQDIQLVSALPSGAEQFFGDAPASVWSDGFSGVNTNLNVEVVLKANTTYTIALFGGKMNSSFVAGTPNFNGLYLENGSGEKLNGTASYDGVTDNSGMFADGVFTDTKNDLAGHTQLVYWTLTTGAEDETIKLHADKGSYNALSIEAVGTVPEPSTFGLLAGICALALVASRRRRARKTA